MADLKPTNASAVARALRNGGLMTVPDFTREGIIVRGWFGRRVAVTITVDAPGTARVLTREARDILTDDGYVLTDGADNRFVVLGRTA